MHTEVRTRESATPFIPSLRYQAPSPVGLEASMIHVLDKERLTTFAEPAMDWGVHKFTGNSSVVWDTAPGYLSVATTDASSLPP